MDPVQQQLERYNAHDVEGFVACYAPEVVIRHGDGRVLMAGLEAVRSRYSGLFADEPRVRATVRHRLVAGDWTVDEELVSLGSTELHVLVGYHVADGLIDQVVMMRSDL